MLRLLVLAILTIILLHIAGPFDTFFTPDFTGLKPNILVSCLAHGIIEEYIFRHVYWKNLKTSPHKASLIYINVLLFWVAHVLLLYYTREAEHDYLLRVYESVSYQLSIVFAGLFLNALYLESHPFPLAACILAHSTLLIMWTLFLGGNNEQFYTKYSINRKSANRL